MNGNKSNYEDQEKSHVRGYGPYSTGPPQTDHPSNEICLIPIFVDSVAKNYSCGGNGYIESRRNQLSDLERTAIVKE